MFVYEVEFSSVIRGHRAYKAHGLQLQKNLWHAGETTVKKLNKTVNTQLGLTLKLIRNLLGMSDGTFLPYIHFLKSRSENKVQVKVIGSRKLENGLVVPGSFMTRRTN